jgi:hypothetical protein
LCHPATNYDQTGARHGGVPSLGDVVKRRSWPIDIEYHEAAILAGRRRTLVAQMRLFYRATFSCDYLVQQLPVRRVRVE